MFLVTYWVHTKDIYQKRMYPPWEPGILMENRTAIHKCKIYRFIKSSKNCFEKWDANIRIYIKKSWFIQTSECFEKCLKNAFSI